MWTVLLASVVAMSSTESAPWLTERLRLIANLRARFNASAGLLTGAHAGGHGFQWRGFSIIDENYLASLALEPYNLTGGDDIRPALANSLTHWLKEANYTKDDRRENLRGVATCIAHGSDPCVEQGSLTKTVAGDNVKASPYAVYTEYNNPKSFLTAELLLAKGGAWVNHQVPLALALHATGDDTRASALFNRSFSLWDGVGFKDNATADREPEADAPTDVVQLHGQLHALAATDPKGTSYATRSLAYFLYAQRALSGRPGYAAVPDAVISAIEAQLWKVQACDSDGSGMAVAYMSDGTASCKEMIGAPGLAPPWWGPSNCTLALSSIETAGLALLPWDDRITAAWYPR